MKLKLDYVVDLKYTNNQSQEQICQMKTSPGLTKPLLNQFQQRYQVFFWLGLRHFLIFLTGTALWRVLYLVKYKNLFHEKKVERWMEGNYLVKKPLQKKCVWGWLAVEEWNRPFLMHTTIPKYLKEMFLVFVW